MYYFFLISNCYNKELEKSSTSSQNSSQVLTKKICKSKPLNAISSKQPDFLEQLKQQKRGAYLQQLEREMEKEKQRMIYYPKAGSYDFGDVVDKIQLARVAQIGDETSLKCVVEWQERSNGVKPSISLVDYREIKKRDPIMMIDYFESRLVRSNGLPYQPRQKKGDVKEDKINSESEINESEKITNSVKESSVKQITEEGQQSEKDLIVNNSYKSIQQKDIKILQKLNQQQEEQLTEKENKANQQQIESNLISKYNLNNKQQEEIQEEKLSESEIILEDEDMKEDKISDTNQQQEEQINVLDNFLQENKLIDLNFGLEDMDDNDNALFLMNSNMQQN